MQRLRRGFKRQGFERARQLIVQGCIHGCIQAGFIQGHNLRLRTLQPGIGLQRKVQLKVGQGVDLRHRFSLGLFVRQVEQQLRQGCLGRYVVDRRDPLCRGLREGRLELGEIDVFHTEGCGAWPRLGCSLGRRLVSERHHGRGRKVGQRGALVCGLRQPDVEGQAVERQVHTRVLTSHLVCHRLRQLGRRGLGLGGHGIEQGQQAIFEPQGIGGLAEGRGAPGLGLVGGNVIHPARELIQGLDGQGQQRLAGRFLVGQPGVVQLLQCPGGLAKLAQPHHARTALEGVEGSAQGRLITQGGRVMVQRIDGGRPLGEDLAGLFQEDVDQLVLFDRGRLNAGGRRQRGGCDFVAQRTIAQRSHAELKGLGRLIGHGRDGLSGTERGIQGQRQHGRRAIQGQRVHEQWWLDRGFSAFGGAELLALTPPQELQFTRLFVIDEKLAGQRALVAQHVDQKAQCPQAVAQALEGTGTHGVAGDFIDHEPLDAVAHAHGRVGGLLQPQHREHAPHLRQTRRHGGQDLAVGRLAEEGVERFLDLGQGGAQLLDHAAHGLAIADTPVQLFHPGLQRAHFLAGQHAVQAIGKGPRALAHLDFVDVHFLVTGLQEQHGRGHLHGQRRPRCIATVSRGFGGPLQGLAQGLAARMQLGQGFRHQGELVDGAAQFVAVAAGQGRPGVGGRGDALARLHQHGRVETAETTRLVISRGMALQAIGLAHGTQQGRRVLLRQAGLGAVEKQILEQTLRHRGFAAGQRRVLHQHA